MSPIDLLPLPLSERISTYGKKKAKTIQKLHEKVRANIEAKRKVYERKANKKQTKVVFEEGDLVWVHLRKERFQEERKSKLIPRIDGPFQILRKISDIVYQLDLQGKYAISSSFNVSDLSPFLADDPDLWTNPFEKEGNDVPRYMDQYMESDQNGDQDVQHSSTEVRRSARTNQTDHAVYRINPRTSGMELRPEPRLDDRTDRTIDVILRPTRQAKTNGRDRITLEREESDSARSYSLLPVCKRYEKSTKFLIIDCLLFYNIIMGRSWIHNMGVVPSTLYHVVKFPIL
ncbi:hypothetical protein N665_0057s0038 [Sinapis alba]|nr:hypothetical protein N665_0057s0038 [Sinapis alba]